MIDVEAMIARHEGTGPIVNGRYRIYQDTVGKWTIGRGRNLSDGGLSEAEVALLFKNDIAKVKEGLTRYLPWFTTLDETRQAVLIDMAFNLGVMGLLMFTNTLEDIRVGKYASAVNRLKQSKWHRQVKSRAVELEHLLLTGGSV